MAAVAGRVLVPSLGAVIVGLAGSMGAVICGSASAVAGGLARLASIVGRVKMKKIAALITSAPMMMRIGA